MSHKMIAVGTPVVAESTRRLYLTAGLIGALTFLYGLALGDSIRAWQSLLVNFLFFRNRVMLESIAKKNPP